MENQARQEFNLKRRSWRARRNELPAMRDSATSQRIYRTVAAALRVRWMLARLWT